MRPIQAGRRELAPLIFAAADKGILENKTMTPTLTLLIALLRGVALRWGQT